MILRYDLQINTHMKLCNQGFHHTLIYMLPPCIVTALCVVYSCIAIANIHTNNATYAQAIDQNH